jgi:uncharacterized OB-fold protein
MDERKPGRPHEPREKATAGRPGLQRCRDCKMYMLYGPDICSYCLSEHFEWVSADPEEEDRV